jgi:hypothetical protein
LLADLDKEWAKNLQRNAQPKLLPLDYRLPLTAVARSN